MNEPDAGKRALRGARSRRARGEGRAAPHPTLKLWLCCRTMATSLFILANTLCTCRSFMYLRPRAPSRRRSMPRCNRLAPRARPSARSGRAKQPGTATRVCKSDAATGAVRWGGLRLASLLGAKGGAVRLGGLRLASLPGAAGGRGGGALGGVDVWPLEVLQRLLDVRVGGVLLERLVLPAEWKPAVKHWARCVSGAREGRWRPPGTPRPACRVEASGEALGTVRQWRKGGSVASSWNASSCLQSGSQR